MSLHSTEAYVGSRHTVFLGVPRICIMSLYFGQVERRRARELLGWPKTTIREPWRRRRLLAHRDITVSLSLGSDLLCSAGWCSLLECRVMIAPGTFLQYPFHIWPGRKTTAQHREHK